MVQSRPGLGDGCRHGQGSHPVFVAGLVEQGECRADVAAPQFRLGSQNPHLRALGERHRAGERWILFLLVHRCGSVGPFADTPILLEEDRPWCPDIVRVVRELGAKHAELGTRVGLVLDVVGDLAGISRFEQEIDVHLVPVRHCARPVAGPGLHGCTPAVGGAHDVRSACRSTNRNRLGELLQRPGEVNRVRLFRTPVDDRRAQHLAEQPVGKTGQEIGSRHQIRPAEHVGVQDLLHAPDSVLGDPPSLLGTGPLAVHVLRQDDAAGKVTEVVAAPVEQLPRGQGQILVRGVQGLGQIVRHAHHQGGQGFDRREILVRNSSGGLHVEDVARGDGKRQHRDQRDREPSSLSVHDQPPLEAEAKTEHVRPGSRDRVIIPPAEISVAIVV